MEDTSLIPLMLLIIVISIRRLCAAQDQTAGFISLDCGLPEPDGYNDTSSSGGLYYTTDMKYIDTGRSTIVSRKYIDIGSVSSQFWNLRFFPEGTRNCYTLRPVHGKGHNILLRVGFFYGDYDQKMKPPQFDLYLGVELWETVTFGSIDDVVTKEIIHLPTSDYVHVCLVNTGLGTPFISLIELRPIDPIYDSTSGSSLKLLNRWYFGAKDTGQIVRYKNNDTYDRIWSSMIIGDGMWDTSDQILDPGPYQLPNIIMQTVASGETVNIALSFSIITTKSILDEIYTYFHIAEITSVVSGSDRSEDLYINGNLSYASFVPKHLRADAIRRTASGHLKYNFTITASPEAKFAPIINAFEAYSVLNFRYYQTDENDVSAINNIKKAYGIAKNWQGDPCSPDAFVWIGINCTYNGIESPRIVYLNLSSSGLNGQIESSISNLTRLEYLDLSNNNLPGGVPDSLSQLPLRYLNLSGNHLSRPLPVGIDEKSKNGTLTLSFGGQTYLPNGGPSSPDRKRNKVIVAIAASIGAILVFLVLSIVFWRKVKKNHQTITDSVRLSCESKDRDNDSFLVSKLRRYTFTEVKCFINEEKILGKGGFGIVYHGYINSKEVAIKVLMGSPQQELKDFQSEVNILATVHHKNLTAILGYFNEKTNKGIICEYLENGSLASHLSGRNNNVLSWEVRRTILVDVAEGLQYLHHGCNPPIIHRDIKPANILLTKDFRAKLADFGFSKPSHLDSDRIVGTPGYRDPKYIHPHMLTEKIDIYSFGVVMLEVVTGRFPVIDQWKHISQWVASMIEMGDIQSIVDPHLEGDFNVNVAWRVVELAMACVSHDAARRPDMNYVVKELKEWLPSKSEVQHNYIKSNYDSDDRIRSSKNESLFKPYIR